MLKTLQIMLNVRTSILIQCVHPTPTVAETQTQRLPDHLSALGSITAVSCFSARFKATLAEVSPIQEHPAAQEKCHCDGMPKLRPQKPIQKFSSSLIWTKELPVRMWVSGRSAAAYSQQARRWRYTLFRDLFSVSWQGPHARRTHRPSFRCIIVLDRCQPTRI